MAAAALAGTGGLVARIGGEVEVPVGGEVEVPECDPGVHPTG